MLTLETLLAVASFGLACFSIGFAIGLAIKKITAPATKLNGYFYV